MQLVAEEIVVSQDPAENVWAVALNGVHFRYAGPATPRILFMTQAGAEAAFEELLASLLDNPVGTA